MSEPAAPEAAPAEGAEAKPKKPNKLVLPLVVALMTVAGGAVGVMVVAPKLMADRTAHEDADSTAARAAEPVGKGPMFKIDNLIVNPAGSQGTRFLMVSVAVETPDAAFEALLRSREPQIRDVVIAMLERQTMESLSITGIRDTLKAQIADTITTLSGAKSKLRVYLPQFVIQ